MIRRSTALHPDVGIGAGRASRFLQHLDAGLVHLHDVVGQEPFSELFDQRIEQGAELDHPACQGGAGQFYTGALQDALLARQRQGILVLGHRDMGQQPG